MLTIRHEQVQKFSEVSSKQFEDHMLAHLHKFFPAKIKAMNEAKIREMIHYGLKRAEGYKFINKSELCKFIDLMAVFGRDFDLSPQHAWAAQILNDKNVKGPVRRMRLLFEAGKKHSGDQQAAVVSGQEPHGSR
jgi:hypothetical protein